MQAPAHSQMPRVLAYHIKVKRSSSWASCSNIISATLLELELLTSLVPPTDFRATWGHWPQLGLAAQRQTQIITAKPNLFHQVLIMMMILFTSNTGMIVFLIDCSDKHENIRRPLKSSVPYSIMDPAFLASRLPLASFRRSFEMWSLPSGRIKEPVLWVPWTQNFTRKCI